MGKENALFDQRMLFLRIGWMCSYEGITASDTIFGGGAYIAEHGYGHEIFNFQPFEGAMYGYVQPPGRRDQWMSAKINLTRLGALPEDTFVSDVLVVWVVTSRAGGAFVAGWYRNATVYREWQPAPFGSLRRHSDTDCGYYVTASVEDAVLLPPDERVFPIPQQGRGEFGQSNVWYADDPVLHQQLRLDILRYIETGQLPSVPQLDLPTPRQPDPLLRQRVERIAIDTTTAYFARLGYRVNSFEQDNVGWDLDAIYGRRKLRLEVKGLSGSQIVVELTPNEYNAMREYRDSYRLCVVTNALIEPRLEVFAYSLESRRWESRDYRVLSIQDVVSARCSSA